MDKGQFDFTKLPYRLRALVFGLKQWTLAVAIVWMCVTLGRWS